MNDSKKKNQVAKVQIDEPTGLMGTQFALNIAQGVLDAIEEAGVTKSQMLFWDQKELRATSKKVTQKILGLVDRKKVSLWDEEKAKISNFYKTCFKNKSWIPNWEQVTIPTSNDSLKRLEFIFPKMTVQEAFNAYADCFDCFFKNKTWKAWEEITKAINPETVQPRPGENYAMLHVGGDEPDLLGKSYDDGISENIIFMTPLEGIISAFRYRFETGKMYDVVGMTSLSALDRNGNAIRMYRFINGRFCVDSYYRGNCRSERGLRQICF